MKGKGFFREFLGAFSDGAVLFPLIALLSAVPGFSGGLLFLSAGLAYLGAALFFRVPMPVQPLKSITVAAVALGASAFEIKISGLLLGLACLLVCLADVERWTRKVPVAVVHQLQAGLGVLLVLQGIKSGWSWPALLLAGGMVVLPEIRGVPVLGLVATGGVIWGMTQGGLASPPGGAAVQDADAIRISTVFGLLLPQVVLTWANSVLATQTVSKAYFGERSKRVTARGLLTSIGVGNVVFATFGGMPFCHGSGGLTAHVRGGASRPVSTMIIGFFLVILALAQWGTGALLIRYPAQLICPLLIATGLFHLRLASPTVTSSFGKLKVATAIGLTIISRNLLWVLAAAVVLEGIEALWARRTSRSEQNSLEAT